MQFLLEIEQHVFTFLRRLFNEGRYIIASAYHILKRVFAICLEEYFRSFFKVLSSVSLTM